MVGGIGTIILLTIFISIFHTHITGFFTLKFISYTSKGNANINYRIDSNYSTQKFAIGLSAYNLN